MATAAANTPSLPDGLPGDWLLDVDLPCPTCQYNLRKLHVPRCPECGGVFRWQTLLHISCPRCEASLESADGGSCPQCALELDWARLLGERDPAEFTQFEYTRRPVRAGLWTWVAALLPRRFWRGIRLESPPAVGRLKRLRRAALVVFALGLGFSLGAIQVAVAGSGYPIPVAEAIQFFVGWAVPALLPLATMLLMPIFTPTLSRFRIRRDQLLRVFAYGAAGLLWLGLVYIGMALLTIGLNLAPIGGVGGIGGLPMPVFPELMLGVEFLVGGGPTSNLMWFPRSTIALSASLAGLIAAIGFVWWWRFFFVALGTYLRLRRRDVWALFLSTQVIALLLILLAMIWIGGYRWALVFGSIGS